MKAIYTDLHRRHDPQFFLVRGVVKRTTEQPERADRLLAGLAAGQRELVAPTVFGQGPRARVHSAEYLDFLAGAYLSDILGTNLTAALAGFEAAR